MIDLDNEPILGPVHKPRKSIEQHVHDAIVNEGRAARRNGVRITACPPYRFEDWCGDWEIGWRDEDSRLPPLPPDINS